MTGPTRGALGSALVRCWPAGLAVLSFVGCFSDDPSGPGEGGVGELVPATAWIEVGSRLAFELSEPRPFSLTSSNPSVVVVESDGSVRGVRPGQAALRARSLVGQSEATVTVVEPVATRTAAVLDSGLTDASLLGLWTADRQRSYAAGILGVLLETRDGGATWRRMDAGTTSDLTGVWGAGPDDVWAVGAGGTILHYDGVAWSPQASGTTLPLLEVWGRSRTEVYAVGLGIALRYDGARWTAMPGAEGAELWAIWGPDADDLFASGQNGVILRWNGVRWEPMPSPTNYILFGLWGTSGADVYAAGIRGTVLHYDGDQWTSVAVPTGADLFALAGSGTNRLLAAGNGGSMLSRDGQTWSFLPQPTTAENLRAIAFDPDGLIRVAGWSGTIIRSGPGAEWVTEISAPPLFSSAIGPDGRLYSVGALGAVYRTDGAVVTRLSPPVRRDLYGVSRTALGRLLVVGDVGTVLNYDGTTWALDGVAERVLLRSVWSDPSDPGRNVIVGENGTILVGREGSWARAPSPTTQFFRQVHGMAGGPIVAVGDSGTIVRGERGGFELMPTPVTTRLRAVWVRAPDDIHAVGEEGVALRYDGRRWYRVPTPTDLELRAVFGLGPTDVYAVGHDGAFLRFDGVGWRGLTPMTTTWLLGLTVGPDGDLIAAGVNRLLLRLAR